jgi:type IV secretion system protein VirD4
MLPQELKAMGEDKQILLVEGMAHPVMSDKIRYFKEAAFKERLLPRVEVPMLVLPGSLPKTFEAGASTPVRREAVEQDASPLVHQSVESSLAQQYEAHRLRAPEVPGEYTGLAGIQREVDGVMSLLDR